MVMPAAQLIQTQSPAPGQSVSVWKEPGGSDVDGCYRKIWQCQAGPAAKAWLSWAHHEHLVLTLLAHRDAKHVVQVAGLQVHPDLVEVVTLDAGPDFQRDWLDRAAAQGGPLLLEPEDALKFARACLKALEAIHALGVMHGDFKSDNLCIKAIKMNPESGVALDLESLRLIDFAYAVYREQPLRFVLPTDPDRLAYMPDTYRAAIKKAQATADPSHIQQAACAQVDLYSLWYMLSNVVPSNLQDGRWMVWQEWMHACRKAAREPLITLTAFDAPTKQMLALTEKMLGQLAEPQSRWAQVATTLPSWEIQSGETPLANAHPTKLLTPLIEIRLSAVTTGASEPSSQQMTVQASSVKLKDQPSSSTSRVRQNIWQYQRWWVIVASLAFLYGWLDHRFAETGLKLTDLGFGLGLLAMALAFPVVLGALWRAVFHSRSACSWVRYPGLVLCGIAAYFLVVLVPVGVSVSQLTAFLVLLTLLVVALLV